MEPPTYLANKNPHERDSHITFDEGPHIYTIDGDSDYTSVTTWNHSHFPHFDADKIIDKMMKSRNWTNSKYFGMTPEQIKKLWKKNGREAAEAGTKMHYDIECFYNECPNENNSTEYKYFKEFEHNRTKEGGFGENMIPYRTEWMIWDKDLKLAGSIDMIYENADGTLDIYDWKRCKEIKKLNKWESAKNNLISHLPNCNFWHYSLQLNTYKAIIERHYGKKIKNMFLVCLHPNNKSNTYEMFRVADLSTEIKDLFEQRMLIVQAEKDIIDVSSGFSSGFRSGVSDASTLGTAVSTVKAPKKKKRIVRKAKKRKGKLSQSSITSYI